MRILTAFLCLALSSFIASAQDAHYWYSEFNPSGFLMPGAVIANNGDSGVYFYNPALFGLTKRSNVSINANVYQYESVNIKNGAGTGRDMKSTMTSSVPLMLSGSVVLKTRKRPLTFAYALTRTPGMAFSASQRRDEKFQVLDDTYSPGTEYFVGQGVYQNAVTESTGQLAFGTKLNEHWSVGITAIGDLKKQSLNPTYTARALGNPGGDTLLPIVTSEFYYLATYNHIGLKFKLGVAYDGGPHHVGLMVTTPLIHIGGSAELVSDQLIVNMMFAQGFFFNILANSRQTKLAVKVKTPLSVAGGYCYDLPKGKIYVAAEYFPKVDFYQIITPRKEGFIRPDTGGNNALTPDLLKMNDSRKSVFNFGFGFSYELKYGISGFVSARTDFSYANMDVLEDRTGFSPYTAYWDNFHWQVGANLKRSKFNMRAGLLFCYGIKNGYPQFVNMDDPNEGNFLAGDMGKVKATHFTAGFLLSYIHNF